MLCTILQSKAGFLPVLCNSSSEHKSELKTKYRDVRLWVKGKQVSKHKLISQRNSTKSICTWAMQDMLLRMVGREAPNEAKEKFWRMVVAATTL